MKSCSIPYVIEQTGKGERAYDVYSRLLSDRVVFMAGEVTEELANAVCAQLLLLQSQDAKKPVHMYISSPGGIVTSGLQIYDVMQYISCPVYTYCLGQAASMAAVLLSSGDRGHRYSLPNSRIMIHQPSGGAIGMASDIEISCREINRLKATLNGILSKNTGRPVSKIEKDTDRDNFMSAKEAVKFGLIDKVISRVAR